jgi:rare lipoprotein A
VSARQHAGKNASEWRVIATETACLLNSDHIPPVKLDPDVASGARGGDSRMSKGGFGVARRNVARRISRWSLLVVSGLAMAGCAASTSKFANAPAPAGAEWKSASVVHHPRSRTLRTVRAHRKPPSATKSIEGLASFYSESTHVASGGRYHPNGLTAAHRSLPFGTRLRIHDVKTGRSVVVVVNDRGPFIRGRVLDLSVGAAKALGMMDSGVNRVRADVL